jgi:glycosyltransferase involved in cell wall biosynthesis
MIGVDPEGLVSAAPLAQMLGVPFVFWSFELLFADEITGTKKKKLKEMEIVVNRQAEFSIIQDRWRGNALVQENGLRPESLIYIPNAPRGPARRQKSDYLHRRLGIDPGRRIILCAGMIDRWTMSMELVQVAAFWPEEFVLVMQSHTPRDGYWTQTYLNEVVRVADPSRVAISFDPIPSSDYRAMMDSADVGLVFYTSQTSSDTTQGRNIRLIGLSSGKLGGFLHSGLPLVVNDAVIGPKELVEQWGCGICVSRPEQIGAALETIFRDYDAYASNAVRCFNQELELGARFSKVIERLDGLLEQ